MKLRAGLGFIFVKKDNCLKNMTDKITKSFIWQFASILPKSIIAPLCLILITKILSVEEYGIYSFLLSLNGYILLLSNLGIPHVLKRYIPVEYSNGNFRNIHIIFKTGFFLNLAFLLSIIVILFFFGNLIGNQADIENFLSYFKVFFLYSVFMSINNLLQILYFGFYAHKVVTLSLLLFNLIRISLLSYCFVHDLSLSFVLYAEVISFACSCVLLVARYWAFYFKKAINDRNIKKVERKRLFQYGGFSFFNDMGAKILETSTDILIIAIFLGPVQAGLYGFCTRLIDRLLPLMPHNLFNSVIEPIVFSTCDTSDKISLNFIFNFLTKFGLFFMMPASIGLWLLSDKIIIYVFDDKFLSAQFIFCIFVTFVLLNTVLERSDLILRVIERPDILLYSKIFAVYNLVLDIAVVKPFGIVGVSLVTTSAIIFKNIFYYYYAKKYSGICLNHSKLIRIAVNCIPMCIFLVFIRIHIDGIPSLLISIIASVMIYGLTAYLNKVFSAEERLLINQKLSRPLFCF